MMISTRRGFFAGVVGLISGILTRRTTRRIDVVEIAAKDPDRWITDLMPNMRPEMIKTPMPVICEYFTRYGNDRVPGECSAIAAW